MGRVNEKIPPRMFGVLAREAAVGVLVRRGRSAWCQMILWDTKRDEITRGQWVKHRVNAFGCNLSPDGRLFAYDARDGRKSRAYEKWVAVSRPPFFSALVLWPVVGPGGGVGVFLSDRDLVIAGCLGDAAAEWGKVPLRVTISSAIFPVAASEERRRRLDAANKLLENGWSCCDREKGEWWERSGPRGKWVLRRRMLLRSRRELSAEQGGGVVSHEYVVGIGEREHAMSRVDWADIDQAGRLVFTRGGKLYAGKATAAGIAEEELADFTRDKPEAVARAGVGGAVAGVRGELRGT